MSARAVVERYLERRSYIEATYVLLGEDEARRLVEEFLAKAPAGCDTLKYLKILHRTYG